MLSDIDKNFTLKLKVQTAYKLTFEVCAATASPLSLGNIVSDSW